MSRRPARGVLYLVAGLFVASGALRFTGETGQAIAQSLGGLTGSDSRMDPAPMPPPELAPLLSALNEREAELDARAAALADRAQALRVAETEITARLTELQAAEEALAATLAMVEGAAETDLTALTAVYENMKPADAALVFAEMTPAFAAGFLGRMRAEAAAEILSSLEPAQAYAISVLLAGRNADVPTE